MMKRLSVISLRPYGDRLCSPAARLWMGSSAVAVLLMASAEAAAWAYVGWFLGTGTWRYAGAVITGLTMFWLVWILDSTLLTLDTTRHEQQESLDRIGSTDFYPGVVPVSRFTKFLRSGGYGIIARVVMVSASLMVSAPYLTQLVFSQDVSAVLQEQDTTKIAAVRRQVEEALARRTRELSKRESELRQELIREAAGKGPSGRIGRGPTVATMEARLKEIQAQIAEADRERNRELLAFDRLSPEELTRKHGVLLQSGGIQARSAAMEVVKEQPGYLLTEWTVRAFVFGLFLAVLILKLFQPRSVEIYYSEARQDGYARYLTGQFDQMLPEQERATAGARITPIRFDEWFRVDYTNYVRQARAMAEMGSISTRHQAEEENLKGIEAAAREDLEPLLEDLDDAVRELARLETEVLEVNAELDSIEREIALHRHSIDTLTSTIKYPRAVGAEEYMYVLDTRKEWTAGLENFERQQRELGVKQQTLNAQVEARRAEIERIQAHIEAKSGVLEDAAARIANARRRTLERIDTVGGRDH